MKRLVTISDRFSGGKSLISKVNKEISKMTSEGMFGILLDSSEEGNVIRMSIDASNVSADTSVCIFPGALSDTEELNRIAGVNAVCILKDGDIEVEGGGEPQYLHVSCPNIEYYQKEVANVPTRIKSIQVEVDNSSQFGYPIHMAGFGLTSQDGQEHLVLTKYKNAKNSNSTLVNVDDLAWMQLDRYKVLFMTVGAGRKVDLTFEIGERFNPAAVLEGFAAALLSK